MSESRVETMTQLRGLGAGGSEDRLHFRLVIQILLRCLPLLKGVRRHLFALAGAALGLLAIFLPLAIMGQNVFWTGVLQGEALPAVQARFLLLDPATSVEVEQLSREARVVAFDHFLGFTLAVLLLVVLPAASALVYYYVWITQRINQALRLQLHDRLQTLSLRFHAEHRVGDAVYRLFQDSAMVSDLLEALFVLPLLHFGRHVVTSAVIFVLDPTIGVVFLLAWPPLLGVGWWISRRLRVGFRATREANSALTSRIQEILAGIKVVKAYGTEPLEQRSFEQHSMRAFEAAFGVRYLVSLFSVIAFVVVCIAMLAATGMALEATRTGMAVFAAVLLGVLGIEAWTLGLFNFFKGEMGAGATSVRIILRMWARVQDMAIGLDRVFELLDLEPEVQDRPDARPFPELATGVAFHGVHFGYQPGHPVLRDVSFSATPGQVIAVVGPTGSGKSTLMTLLLRLFDPDAGRIEVGGVDLRDIRLDSLRRKVSIALQENLLFGSTVADNIGYAVEGATPEQIREAARIACADEFIEQLPERYDTLLGERGAKLSTGQRQRISIARAVLKDSPILVLDEPTAALDADTEMRVLRNLHEWGSGRVIFLVTHRLATIHQADTILVLRDGRLVESGAHAALMAEAGLYRRLVEQENRGAEGIP